MRRSEWTPHFLEAQGSLAEWRTALEAEIERAFGTVAQVTPPGRIDILVACRPREVIPEIGSLGHAYSASLFSIACDPGNPAFVPSLSNGTFCRQLVHEAHHCLRMAGPGYGRTLGEALVSEGLAGQFVRHLFGSPPEPWERAVDEEVMRRCAPDDEALRSISYDHDGWFFGRNDILPRWLGYSLGYAVAGEWLRRNGVPDDGTWVNVPASAVLAAGRDAGLLPVAS